MLQQGFALEFKHLAWKEEDSVCARHKKTAYRGTLQTAISKGDKKSTHSQGVCEHDVCFQSLSR